MICVVQKLVLILLSVPWRREGSTDNEPFSSKNVQSMPNTVLDTRAFSALKVLNDNCAI